MKHIPKPTFSPYKGVMDHLGPLNKPKPKIEETKSPNDEEDEGFEME
jgi:hypothetical protein